jgi:alkanesulfonate monooxygenase SsuD/methylene tetrahydromethanopterin reductase-like flavin-dependent oxidoreductase (luciferase family)
LFPQRDPIQTAKSVATVDYLSNGRFIFGTGVGWNQAEIENHGTNFKTRLSLTRERIEAMREIWTKSKAEYHGKYVNFEPMMTWPKPVQNPPIDPGRWGAACSQAGAGLWKRLDAELNSADLPHSRSCGGVGADEAGSRAGYPTHLLPSRG